MPETQELKVFISTGESTCDDCGQKLGRHAWICLAGTILGLGWTYLSGPKGRIPMNMIKIVVVFSIAWTACGCARPANEAWTSKSDSTMARPPHASNVADDQPVARRGNERLSLAPVPPPPAPPPPQTEPLKTLAEYRQDALMILRKAADSASPQLRANAIEYLQPLPDDLEPIVRKALADDNRGVRFVAAMTIGKLKINRLAPLLEPLLHDESESVQAAAIYGLRRCGRQTNPTPLAAMLVSDDPEIKGNAALVLGELQDKSAIQVLEHAVGRGLSRVEPARAKIVELQLAEAMVKLGAENQVMPIRAALFAPAEQSEIIALACQMCGALKDGKAAPDLNNILLYGGPRQRPAEVRMAAAMALAQIDPGRAHPEIPLQYVQSEHDQLRAQAATTLGAIGDPTSLPYLAHLLNDPNPIVQAAAAGAVLRMREGER